MEDEYYPWTIYLVTAQHHPSLMTQIIWEDDKGKVWGTPNPYGKAFVSKPVPQGARGLFFPLIDHLAHYLDANWAYNEATHRVVFIIKPYQDTVLTREILTAIWRYCFGLRAVE